MHQWLSKHANKKPRCPRFLALCCFQWSSVGQTIRWPLFLSCAFFVHFFLTFTTPLCWKERHLISQILTINYSARLWIRCSQWRSHQLQLGETTIFLQNHRCGIVWGVFRGIFRGILRRIFRGLFRRIFRRVFRGIFRGVFRGVLGKGAPETASPLWLLWKSACFLCFPCAHCPPRSSPHIPRIPSIQKWWFLQPPFSGCWRPYSDHCPLRGSPLTGCWHPYCPRRAPPRTRLQNIFWCRAHCSNCSPGSRLKSQRQMRELLEVKTGQIMLNRSGADFNFGQ